VLLLLFPLRRLKSGVVLEVDQRPGAGVGRLFGVPGAGSYTASHCRSAPGPEFVQPPVTLWDTVAPPSVVVAVRTQARA